MRALLLVAAAYLAVVTAQILNPTEGTELPIPTPFNFNSTEVCPEYTINDLNGYYPTWCASKNPFIFPQTLSTEPEPEYLVDPVEQCNGKGLYDTCTVINDMASYRTKGGMDVMAVVINAVPLVYLFEFHTEKIIATVNVTLTSVDYIQTAMTPEGAYLALANSTHVNVYGVEDVDDIELCAQLDVSGSGGSIFGLAGLDPADYLAYPGPTNEYQGIVVHYGDKHSHTLSFIELTTCAAGGTTLSEWTITPDGGGNLPTLAVETVDHVLNYNISASAPVSCTYATGREVLVLLASPGRVLVVYFDPTVATLELPFTADSEHAKFNAPALSGDISTVAVVGECVVRNKVPSQQLWLTVGLSGGCEGCHNLTMIALPEFGEATSPGDSVENNNPACNANQWYNTKSDVCVSRFNRTMPLPFPSLFIAVRFKTFPSELTLSEVDINVFLYSIIFVVTENREMHVFSAQQRECQSVNQPLGVLTDCSDEPTFLSVELLNQVVLIGDVTSLYASQNAQHVFLTLRRYVWEQKGMARFSELCSALVSHKCGTVRVKPSDELLCASLEPYAGECTQLDPHPFSPFSFIEWFSMCPPMYLCTSLYGQKLKTTAPGSYANRPQQELPCPDGSFCLLGQKINCPPGYICPYTNMSLPIKCRRDVTMATTCYNQSLTEPEDCPDGNMCLTMDTLPLPAPEGTYTSIADRSQLYTCEKEDYCPLQRFNSSHNKDTDPSLFDLLCPAGTYCESSSVLVPVACGAGDYCPQGSSAKTKCPAGYVCETPLTAKPCTCGHAEYNDDGFAFTQCQYCPEGTIFSEFCPAGYYCPVTQPSRYKSVKGSDWQKIPAMPSKKVQCPEGHYCPPGYSFPLPCPAFSVCKAGASSLSGNIANWIVIAVVFFAIGIGYVLYTRAMDKKAASALADDHDKILYFAPPHLSTAYLATVFIVTAVIVGVCVSVLRKSPNVAGVVWAILAVFLVAVYLVTPSRYTIYDDRLVVVMHWPLKPLATVALSDIKKTTRVKSFVPALGCTSPERLRVSYKARGAADVSSVTISPTNRKAFLNALSGAMSVALEDMSGEGESLLSQGLSRKTCPVTLSFTNLELVLPNGKKILSGVSGSFRPGRITAIMGPSGAGKTTVMNVISGKVDKTSGELFINGKPGSMTEHRSILGFVPQEDIMHRELTVFEILSAQAALRLPSFMSAGERASLVKGVIEILGLEDVQHSIIGDESRRGISGGQRKRVNIGMELVADPTVLFLDEPTSGLDATASQQVVDCLRQVAEKFDLTIITVIHQPRYEIFTTIHDCLLLGKGGRTVYLGECNAALGYFESLGFELPPHCNPSDFFLDAISGDIVPVAHTTTRNGGGGSGDKGGGVGGGGGSSKQASVQSGEEEWTPAMLFDLWNANDAHQVAQQQLLLQQRSDFRSGVAVVPPVRNVPSFWQQFKVFLWRAVIIHIRDLQGIFLDNFLVLLAGGLMGLVYYNQAFVGPLPELLQKQCPKFLKATCALPQNDQLMLQFLLVCMGLGITAVTSSLRVFGRERIIFWRESAAGINRFAYYAAKMVGHLHNLLLPPFILLAAYYNLTNMIGPIGLHFATLIAIQFCCVGVGYVVSVSISPQNAQIAGVVYCFLGAMFSGANPPLAQLQDMHALFMTFIFYTRWGMDALYFIEIGANAEQGQVVSTSINFWGVCGTPGYCADKSYCRAEGVKDGICLNPHATILTAGVVYLLIMGVFFRIVGFLLLAYTNRKKQR